MSLPLPSLFARCVSHASKASNAPVLEESTQDLVKSTLTDLKTLSSRIAGLSLFSPNETLEDISTKDLIYLLVPYVIAQARERLKTVDREERISVLQQTQKDYKTFLDYLNIYHIVPEEERKLYEQRIPISNAFDASQRREIKIRQYQKEKALKCRIEVTRKRRGQRLPSPDSSLSDLYLISSLLPTLSQAKKSTRSDDEELGSETEEILRDATLLLLRFFYTQTHAHLASMNQELELLLNAPPSPPRDGPDRQENTRGKERDSDMWKLDSPLNLGSDREGPLLDESGKPLRPFTILPSSTANRARLQAQVFGPGHRLPTISIDEYLQIERERGNILTGGGPATETAPTSSEQLALEAEMDGTRTGEEKAEAKRLKDENWARFTDENPRGAGNTMNRG